MINPQRLTKSLGNWSRKSLIPFVTPFPDVSKLPLRVSARVLFPRSYDIVGLDRVFPLRRPSQPALLDLRTLSEHVTSENDRVFLDPAQSFLFINFYKSNVADSYNSTAVIFPDGAMVTWYMRLDSELQLASDVTALHRSVLAGPDDRENAALDQFNALEHIENIPVSPGTPDSRPTYMDGDAVTLTGVDSNRSNEMLAVSMGLGAAVRMNVIESLLRNYIERGQSDVSGSLTRMNQWRLSQISECVFEAEKGVHRWRYLLGSKRHTSVPDSLWEYDDLDRLYDSVAAHFELNERYEDLQSQLTYYSDFLKTVGDYVRHGYSSRLEKIIILIIAIEAAIALRHLYLEIAFPVLAN
jgi:uncharacterized Rmd1/YagE family protein